MMVCGNMMTTYSGGKQLRGITSRLSFINGALMCRESWEEYSFHGAVHHCIGADAKDGPFLGLMPIGKLRHFRNRYAFDDFFDSEHFKNRLCR